MRHMAGLLSFPRVAIHDRDSGEGELDTEDVALHVLADGEEVDHEEKDSIRVGFLKAVP